MNSEQWAKVRKRAYMSLPWAGAIMVAYGLTSESTAALWVGLAGAIIGPIQGHVAAAHVDTAPSDDDAGEQSLYGNRVRGRPPR